MKVFRTISDLAIPRHATVGFVPTMGAFHEGHLSLMRKAKEECEVCVVSLFVNPTQFAAGEDFERYPRDEARDLHLAESAGADVVFAPSVEEMYTGSTTRVVVDGISERWEGSYRPGHFEGVATVVCKLFNIVRPDIAYFGLKDYQQCRVVQQMVTDLHLGVRLSFEPTLREADGLAMSSRNAYLDPQLRRLAPELYRQLLGAASATLGGVSVEAAVASASANLTRSGFEVQYLACVDPISLEPVDRARPDSRLIVAAKLGTTRLIDNIALAEAQ